MLDNELWRWDKASLLDLVLDLVTERDNSTAETVNWGASCWSCCRSVVA